MNREVTATWNCIQEWFGKVNRLEGLKCGTSIDYKGIIETVNLRYYEDKIYC